MTVTQFEALLGILVDGAADLGMQGKAGFYNIYKQLEAVEEAVKNKPKHCDICNSGVCDHVWYS